MKLLALVVIGGIGLGLGLAGCKSAPPARPASATHRDMLAVMERFLAAPLTAPPEDLDRITRFAVESSDVQIVIEEGAVPFLSERLDSGASTLLLTGFIAGNAAPQLRAGVKRDELFAGIDGELAVYRALQAAASARFRGRQVRSPGLDALLELEAKGQLRAHLERMLAARKQAAATEATGADQESDEALSKLSMEGVRLMKAGRAEEALTYFDKVIASYEPRYQGERRRVYCAAFEAEAQAYEMEATNKGQEAITLSAIWSDAWFFKAYALGELQRFDDARAAVERAVALSPHRAHYLLELGFLHQKARQWQRSLELYKSAENKLGFISDPQLRDVERGRAWRGQGHALIELGDLDAAEQKFQQSLALDPDDTASKKTLEYIHVQRAKKKKK